MLLEINFASTHILSWLKASPRLAQSDELCERFLMALSSLLEARYLGHWHPNHPYLGNGYRAITAFNGQFDKSLVDAADQVGISAGLLQAALPSNFVIWVDPMDVSYRCGDYGYPVTIWSQRAVISPYVPKKSSPLRISSPKIDSMHAEDIQQAQLTMAQRKEFVQYAAAQSSYNSNGHYYPQVHQYA